MAAPLLAVGLGISAFQIWSGLQQAKMITRQAGLQNQINDMNAKYAELDAYEAEKFGYTQTSRYQTVIDSTVGTQRASYAAQNVDINFGTAAEVQAETKLIGFLNQLDMQKEARLRAKGLKIEASNIRLGGAMSASKAAMDSYAVRMAGITGAASTGFQTAASAGYLTNKDGGTTGYKTGIR